MSAQLPEKTRGDMGATALMEQRCRFSRSPFARSAIAFLLLSLSWLVGTELLQLFPGERAAVAVPIAMWLFRLGVSTMFGYQVGIECGRISLTTVVSFVVYNVLFDTLGILLLHLFALGRSPFGLFGYIPHTHIWFWLFRARALIIYGGCGYAGFIWAVRKGRQ